MRASPHIPASHPTPDVVIGELTDEALDLLADLVLDQLERESAAGASQEPAA